MLSIQASFVIALTVSALTAGGFANSTEIAPPVGRRMQLAPPDGSLVLTPTPVTFGVVFRRGDIERGKTLKARMAGTEVPVQLDAKRHYPDGSLKHGVVSFVLPKLSTAADLEFLPMGETANRSAEFEDAARKLLAGDFDATVNFQFPEGCGKPVSVSARKLLQAAGTKAATWLKGPVAIEWLLSGVPMDEAGQADPDLSVEFQVRYYPQLGIARVSAVVEKCSDGGSDGGLIYDVTFRKGRTRPEIVFEQKAVRQPDLTRFRKVFWVGKAPAEVVVRHDAPTMAAAGVIPQYDFSLVVAPSVVEEQWKQWQDPRIKKGLFENGVIVAYFGTTGGRADIGPLPAWDVYYLYTMDPRQKQIMTTTDELAAGVPIHGRERATGRAISYDTRPKLWFADERGGQYGTEKFRPKPAPPRVQEKVPSIFSPETAHLPGFSYLSYVVTGDYFFLEETYFWAGYVVLSENPGYSKGTIYNGQLRGCAWGLRTVALAAGIAPDGDPEKEGFAKRVEYTLRSHLAALQGPDAHPLGVLPIGNHGDGKWVYAPWQHDYMIMAADCAAGAGFKDAQTLRRLMLEFSMGRFTHAPDFDPQYGCGYWWVFEDRKSNFKAATWKALFGRNSRENPEDLARLDYPGSYCDLALATSAIGIRTGFPSARRVHDFLSANAKSIVAKRASYPSFAFSAEPIQ
jgi:hypothetical protein